MKENNLLSSSSVQSFDELLINQPDFSNDENENEASERLSRNSGSKKQSWVWKYFESKKVVEVIEKKSNYINVEVIYSTCNVLNNSSIKCNVQLKIVEGSTSKLISHLWKYHGIMQNGHESDDT